ncbi:hypothetical protein ACFHYQ_23355 [Sphaerimonospora cavernae]|uniref:Uncharacterized protein n=1 Tax=Sphaerimonospora cavernae TaxID=1740611 RepID=A0ABV6UAK1_9ACTN
MSRTTRSRRGRCIALAAVTAGVSWLTTGPAMAGPASAAGDGATAALVCGSESGSKQAASNPTSLTPDGLTLHELTPSDLTTLAPAAGVLSITDAAGAAAGQGMRSLPDRPATTLPAGITPASPTLKDLTPAGGTAVLPAARAGVMPILAAAPSRPAVSNAVCLPATPMSAIQRHPRPHNRVHPMTETNPERHRHPNPGRPQAPDRSQTQTGANAAGPVSTTDARTPAGAANRPHGRTEGRRHKADARTAGALPGQAQDRPRRRNRGGHSQPETMRPHQQGGVNQAQDTGGQRNATRPAPRQARPAQPGTVRPGTAQTPAQTGAAQPGTAQPPAQTGAAQPGAAHNKRQRRHQPNGQTGHTAPASTSTSSGSAPAPRRVKREGRVQESRMHEGRVYPKAVTEQLGTASSTPGDITTPALASATATGSLADLAGAAGRKLLP